MTEENKVSTLSKLPSLFKGQFFRFLIVGGFNAFFGYGALVFFLWIKLPHSLAFLFATTLGVIFNFFTTGRLVFKNSNNRLFAKFILGYLFLYILNLSLFKTQLLFLDNIYIASLVSTMIVSIAAYFVNKKFVFAS